MSYPNNYKYTKDHEWLNDTGSNSTFIVGITDFAQSELGEIVFVELPQVGKTLKQGDTMCVVESTKAASDVYAPISGKVVEVNAALSSNPTLINSNAHDQGWIAKIEATNSSELTTLMSAGDYEKTVK